MLCVFHLMRRIGQGGEHHGPALFIHLKEHPPACPVRDGGIAHPLFRAAFLGDDIARQIILHQILIDPQLRAPLPVRVSLPPAPGRTTSHGQ